jgi:hypothetical protein
MNQHLKWVEPIQELCRTITNISLVVNTWVEDTTNTEEVTEVVIQATTNVMATETEWVVA